jgi:hypothetical protein
MTQKIRVADEDLAKLFRREQELNRRILEGTLDIDLVLSDLQKLIEGKSFSPKILKLFIISSLSLSDCIALGKYDWVNDHINEKNFPTKTKRDYEVEYRIFHLNKYISSESAIAEMEKEGFKPGNILELLKFGDNQPELQRQFPIVALGSVWRNANDGRIVPVLDYVGGKRKLDLYRFGHDWLDRYRFLGVRNIS